jgi:hypothetical protein
MNIRRSERPQPLEEWPEAWFEALLLAWFWRSLPGQAVRFTITPPDTLRGAKVRVNRLARLTHRRIRWAPEGRPVVRVEAIEPLEPIEWPPIE